MKKLRDIMRHGFLFTVQRGATVAEAARTMAANNVGIVAVLDGDRLAGVFSERDVVQKVVDRGLDPTRTPVADGMTARAVGAAAGAFAGPVPTRRMKGTIARSPKKIIEKSQNPSAYASTRAWLTRSP